MVSEFIGVCLRSFWIASVNSGPRWGLRIHSCSLGLIRARLVVSGFVLVRWGSFGHAFGICGSFGIAWAARLGVAGLTHCAR